jgi:predicted N-acyltransferase
MVRSLFSRGGSSDSPSTPATAAAHKVRVLDGLHAIEPAAWDACAGPENPFLSHAFLSALEESGSVAADTGWLPRHLIVEDEAGGPPLAAAPLYLKGHSYGEYVFDHGWADAYERAGGQYYPKLLSAVPFTPVPGPRLMLRPGAPESARGALIAAMVQLAERDNISSVHVTFPQADDYAALGAAGFLQRVGVQFHWHNRGYRDFDGFLASLSSRKRKMIRKERAAALSGGITVHALTGSAIEPRHWDAFFRFYMNTSDRKWGSAYLNREFFDLLGGRLADRVLLVMAEKNGRLVGGALNLIGTDTLYGRNWGCVGDFPFLHFECCYYQAIEFAIARGLVRVEAGAQGPHKLQRGYLPVETWSAHWICNAGFRRAVEDFLGRERRMKDREIGMLEEHSPYRHEDGQGGPGEI